jgi:hypothetical protein
MANLPNITHTEVAMVAAAVLLLFIAPAFLSWGDARRRRRAEQAAIAAESLRLAATLETTVPAPDTLPVEVAPPEEQAPVEVDAPSPPDLVTAVPTSVEPESVPQPAPVLETVPTSSAAFPTRAELQPLSGAARHRFRLDELHRAQLPDWPPAAIRDDSERSRLRQEAERSAEPYQARMNDAVIASPYPARSQCLGAADADASELRLSFLLFPVLWPVSQNQAVAQAVFRIDRSTGEIRGWVDALRPPELSDENRREILEAGGEV